MLVVHPRPFLGESLTSYLHRVTARNGYPSVEWVTTGPASGKRLRVSDYESDTNNLEVLAGQCGVAPDVLWDLTMHRYAPRLNWAETPRLERSAALRSIVGGTRPRARNPQRFCPKCLAEALYTRLAWRLRPMPACLKHSCLLIDHCSQCGSAVTFGDLHTGRCTCGASLSETVSMDLEPAVIEGLLVIDSALHGPDEMSFEPWGLSSRQYLRVLGVMARWMEMMPETGYLRVNGLQCRGTLTRDDRHAPPPESDLATFVGAQRLLSSWTSDFPHLLEIYRSREGATRFQGVTGEFRPVMDLIRRYLPRPEFEFVWDSLGKYLQDHWTGGYYTAIQIFNKHGSEYCSKAKAGKLLGTSCKAIIQLVARQRLAGRLMPQKSGPSRVLVQRKSVENLIARRADLMSLPQAAARLGLPTPVTEVLLEHGILVADRGPLMDGHSKWLVHPTDIDEFLRRSFSCARTLDLDPHDEPELTRITDVISIENVLDVVPLLLSGNADTVWYRSRPCTLQDLLVRVDRFVSQAREPLATTKKECARSLSLDEASVLSELSSSSLALIGERGLITITQGNTGAQHISASDLNQFSQRYVSGPEACRILRTSSGTLETWTKAGILTEVHRHGSDVLLLRSELHRLRPANRMKTSDVVSEYRVGRHQVSQMVKQGRLTPLVPGHRPTLFLRSEVNEAFIKTDQVINSTIAALILGVSPAVVARWAKEGRLQPLAGPSAEGYSDYRFDREAVQRMRDASSMVGSTPHFAQAEEAQGNSVLQVPASTTQGAVLTSRQIAERLSCTISQFHKRYVSTGRLVPLVRQKHCMKMFYSLADVQQLELEVFRDLPLSELISAQEAADTLGIDVSLFHARYTRSGVLPIVRLQGTKQFYRRSDVDRIRDFRASHVSSGQARAILRVSHATLYRWAQEGIIKCAAGPKNGGFGDNLYSLAEIERVRQLLATKSGLCSEQRKNEQDAKIAQRLGVLGLAEQVGVPEAARRAGLSKNTIYNWRRAHRHFGEEGLRDRPSCHRSHKNRRAWE